MWQYNQTPDTRDFYNGMQSRQSGDALHYGVLGMKWGVRRAKNKVAGFGKTGSDRTQKRIEAYDSLYNKYNKKGYMTAHRASKLRRAESHYQRSVQRDLKTAMKADDRKTFNRLLTQRTAAKLATDQRYLNKALSSTAKKDGDPRGITNYKTSQNVNTGMVDVSVNGSKTKSSYAYGLSRRMQKYMANAPTPRNSSTPKKKKKKC